MPNTSHAGGWSGTEVILLLLLLLDYLICFSVLQRFFNHRRHNTIFPKRDTQEIIYTLAFRTFKWCPGPESNRQARYGRGILSPLRLPIPPPGPIKKPNRIEMMTNHFKIRYRIQIFSDTGKVNSLTNRFRSKIYGFIAMDFEGMQEFVAPEGCPGRNQVYGMTKWRVFYLHRQSRSACSSVKP